VKEAQAYLEQMRDGRSRADDTEVLSAEIIRKRYFFC